MSILGSINASNDIKKLDARQLPLLCTELREEIIRLRGESA